MFKVVFIVNFEQVNAAWDYNKCITKTEADLGPYQTYLTELFRKTSSRLKSAKNTEAFFNYSYIWL